MRARLTFFALGCAGLTTWALSACSSAGGGPSGHDSAAGSGGGGGSSPIDITPDSGLICDPNEPGSPCGPDAPAPRDCGNGILTADEACDDGGREAGDGCSANCLVVDAGYSCNPPGEPCHEIARCGDAVVSLSEPCDDGNQDSGDGCSPRCKLEIGFKCDGEPSTCTPTVCGDGVQEGAESCEDSNTVPFDGCSASCQTEPDCSTGACTSECGDGLVIGEDCDDGNRTDGDGCSADCTVEEGFECVPGGQDCEEIGGECVMRVSAIFRDFQEEHPDFQVGCGVSVPNIVEMELNEQGKPVLADGTDACIESAASFGEWFTDNAENATIVSDIVLFANGDGGFVNRWGENGEQWAGQTEYSNVRWCGPAGSACEPGPPDYSGCTLAPGEQCWDPCGFPGGTGANSSCAGSSTQELFDGNPVFFPIDDAEGALTDTRYEAKIAADYGYTSWPWEKDVVPGAGKHNFHFTTEVIYWFQYDASKSATLDFTGDDDVWVFVNGHLAVDLGGLHPPENGSVTIDDTSAADYELEDGKVYKIAVFHAERKTEGSSFKLTLDGFSTGRSDCSPVCGDGIVGLGEECDDGVNDGGYGECDDGCVLGAFCGDGIKQDGEDCDDGNRIDGDTCGSACRVLVVR